MGNTINSLVLIAITRLNDLKSAIAEYNTSANSISTAVFDHRSSWPFYEWSKEEHSDTISDLLKGQHVLLRADITRGPKLNAIKFNEVELVIRAGDSDRQTELDAILRNFTVKLVHMGNSYYRCGAKYYTISSPSQTITYSIEKTDGQPSRTNSVYSKLKHGNLVLSPYAMWTIQLEHDIPESKTFDQLAAFAGDIDLLLIGHGQYVTENAPVCNDLLDRYYRLDDTISNHF